ncbi:MAG: hypothetical protein JNL83_22525 [Myxococcales bacterium]|nr:hypothetical protein [Myxococcales bacterium]
MRRGRLVAVAIVVAAACASAGKESGGGGPDGKQADASTDSGGGGTDSAVTVDGPMADAAPVAVTLSQNTNGTMIGSASSIACGNNTTGDTRENSWYRVFKLADHNIVGGLHVTAVTFGVQEASGSPQVQVKIGTYSGNITPPPATLDTGLITPLNAATFTVPNTVSTAATTVTVPISANVPALSQMIVEVFSPDFNNMGRYFYLGGNGGGESKPSYLRAPTCNETQPKTTTALGFPTSHLVITVAGTK